MFLGVVLLFPGQLAGREDSRPITLRTMGSLFFGGTVTHAKDGDTFHGDHGYAQFYIPQKSRDYPVILWHGIGQSGRSWESTPDGREGYQAILPRRGWATYIIDQPRRGRAGYTQVSPSGSGDVPTTARESSAWNAFRNGVWVPPAPASLFAGSQFPGDAASIEQFFRQQAPNTGDEPRTDEHRRFMGETMAALLERTGPAVLVTHSNSGQYGWFTGMIAPDKVGAIVAYEPGQFVFPDDEPMLDVPFKNALAGELLQGIPVPAREFQKLTRMPILVVYGDNISTELSDVFNVEVWRISRARARAFVEAVNRHGGDATLLVLPEEGIMGNTHAPFADRNNLDIADMLEEWLHEKGLDGSAHPHTGPAPAKRTELTIPLLESRALPVFGTEHSLPFRDGRYAGRAFPEGTFVIVQAFPTRVAPSAFLPDA